MPPLCGHSVTHSHPPLLLPLLQDPTGAIGGTLTRAVLQGEAGIQQGAVVRLRNVTVLRTPPPRSLSHLCVTLDSVVQVIEPAAAEPEGGCNSGGGGLLAATASAQRPHVGQLFPALPAPPLAHPSTSHDPLPARLAVSAGAALTSQPGLAPPPPAGCPPAAPTSSRTWLAAPPLQWQQQQQQQQFSGSFAVPMAANSSGWPSSQCTAPLPAAALRLDPQGGVQLMPPPPGRPPRAGMSHTGGAVPPPRISDPSQLGMQHGQQQRRQQMTGFSSGGGFSTLPGQPQRQAAWQDDATSAPACSQKDASLQNRQLLPCSGGHPAASQEGGAAGWLQGLLAEAAEFDPFSVAGAGGLPSQPAGTRLPLVERQPMGWRGPPLEQAASKRQCSVGGGGGVAAPGPSSASQLGPGGGAETEAWDDLELDMDD